MKEMRTLNKETFSGIEKSTLFYPRVGKHFLGAIGLFSPFVKDCWFAGQGHFSLGYRPSSGR